MSKQIYCCLDIEGTGLDPKKDAVTEVGAVLFEISSTGKVKFLEEFSELVNPGRDIPVFIQELTGITEEMVKDAPSWDEVRPRFGKFVGKYPILGQNVGFDIGFLASHGLAFEQPSIDTKELAQIFLPQVKHYNLEFLMRHFEVPLENHHRALDDAKSTALLLGKIVEHFTVQPKKFQEIAVKILGKSKLPYTDIFHPAKKSIKLAKKLEGERQVETKPVQGDMFAFSESKTSLAKKAGDFVGTQGPAIVCLPTNLISEEGLKACITTCDQDTSGRIAFALPLRKLEALNLDELPNWKKSLPAGEYFCSHKLGEVLKEKNFSDSLARFLLKISANQSWYEDNFLMADVYLDGEDFVFKDMVAAGPECLSEESHVCGYSHRLRNINGEMKVLVPYESLVRETEVYKKFDKIFVWDAIAFEEALSVLNTKILPLKSMHSLFRALYDSEKKSGILASKKTLREESEKIFNRFDLDFGLLGMTLALPEGFFPQRVVDEYFRGTEGFLRAEKVFGKLVKSILNFSKKLIVEDEESLALKFFARRISEEAEFLQEFFSAHQAQHVYWVESFSSQLKLKRRPFRNPLKTMLPANSILFSSLLGSSAQNYFQDRFAWPELQVVTGTRERRKLSLGLPEGFPLPKNIASNQVTLAALKKLLKEISGRAVVFVPSIKVVEEYHEILEREVGKHKMVSQRVTGHTWKNFELYSSGENTVWLMTPSHFWKSKISLPPTETLIFTRLPYEPSGIYEAIYEKDEIFQNFVLPRAALRLAHIVSGFMSGGETDGDKKIFFLDQRITQDYNSELLETLEGGFETEERVLSPDFEDED